METLTSPRRRFSDVHTRTDNPDPRSPLATGVARLLGGRRLLVASLRGPVRFRPRGHELEPVPAAGGLVSALAALAGQVPLTWVAAPSDPADHLAALRSGAALMAIGGAHLRYVSVPAAALSWSYRRFSNPVLWLLQHDLWDELRRPDLSDMIVRSWWLGYRPVNEAFARSIAEELRADPSLVVQIHDYHLYLVPRLVRQANPHALLQHFTHIPWPGPEGWLPLPAGVRRDLCEGLLGADVLGFQTSSSAMNFLRCCEQFVPGARIDVGRSTVWLGGRATRVRDHPISVDPAALRRQASSTETLAQKERLRGLCGEQTIVRVDRLDPSKNVAQGFRAFGLLLDSRPDLVGRVRMLAFLVPSRESIAEYRRCAQQVWYEVKEINTRFGRNGWNPVEVFYEDNRAQALAGMALADVLLVNSVADGMNLVAKEGVIVGERDPVLVLSRSCGAYAQLGAAAVCIPPRDVQATAAALERALGMPQAERRNRAAVLRSAIEREDLSWWLRRQLCDLLADETRAVRVPAAGLNEGSRIGHVPEPAWGG